jgi:hypothetical protein
MVRFDTVADWASPLEPALSPTIQFVAAKAVPPASKAPATAVTAFSLRDAAPRLLCSRPPDWLPRSAFFESRNDINASCMASVFVAHLSRSGAYEVSAGVLVSLITDVRDFLQ